MDRPARLSSALCVLVAALSGVGAPSFARGSALDRIDEAERRGRIGAAEAARQRYFYAFDRRRVDATWRAGGDPPAKCGTTILDASIRERPRLDPETRAALDARLAALAAPGTSSYTTAHFRITYATSGPDAPILADVAPANGVPDFVEATGAACEQAWATEVVQLGYTAPAVGNGGNARYPVTYQAQDSYGFTVVVSGQQTQIVLHPSYAGFPLNDDPDGDVLGALRVTVAHELKHAIQRMYTPWSEGGWIELDATWIEEVVFDPVNDSVHFLRGSGSAFTEPGLPLFFANQVSYEDWTWETYLAGTLGADFLRGFWVRRRDFLGESVLLSWQQVLAAAGTDLAGAWGGYVAWNVASGDHALPGYGYEEAATYPTTPATFVHESLPAGPDAWSVNGTAASAHLFPNPDATLGGTPEIVFDGVPGGLWQVTLLAGPRGGGAIVVPIPIVSGKGTLDLTGVDWGELEWAAVVVGNPTPANPPLSYSLTARALAPILLSHDRLLDRAESSDGAVARVRVAPGSSVPDPSSVTLTFRVNGGAATTLAMSPTGVPQEYAATLPVAAAGSVIAYRIEARSVGGDVASSPAIAGAFHSFQVVTAFEPFEDAVSANGWTVGAAGDDAVAGRWERAAPRGTIAAPYADATPPLGTLCFVTQNGSFGGAAEEADVDGGTTTLTSPVYSFFHGALARAEARYRRWYSNDVGGRPDDVWRVDASNDGGATWVNVESVATGEERWVPVTVDLLVLFGTPDRVRFRFVAQDGGAPSLVEAALDDVTILAVPANPVAVGPDLPGARMALSAPAPNPCAGSIRLRLWLPEPAPVWAGVRDVQGRMVRSLLRGELRPAGASSLEWDGRASDGSASRAGVYWLEARSGHDVRRRKVVRLASGLSPP
jgi:hypothetical protein